MMNSEQTSSLIRAGLKIGGTALVTFGVMSNGQADQLVPVVTEIVGGIAALVGLFMSWKIHK
jgi:hypothetical protein